MTYKVKEEDPRKQERAERIEEEAKKRRWDLARMYRNAVEWVARFRMK